MIDYLVYKSECFDTEAYREELKECGKGIMVLCKWVKTQELWVEDRLIFKFNNNFIYNMLASSLIMVYYSLRYRPRLLVIENTFICAIMGWVRFGKLIYFGGDWLPHPLFKIADFISCLWANVVWDTTPLINAKRKEYWKRNICKKNTIYVPRIKKDFIPQKGKGVLFLGSVREDSGLYLCNHLKSFNLVIPNHVPREEMKEEFSDCFCGINLLTSKDSWTIYTTPSKIFDYIRFGLPPIVSTNCGFIADLISYYKLGRVIDVEKDDLEKTLWNVYNKQDYYRKNIDRFFEEIKTPRLKEVFSLTKQGGRDEE